MGIVKVDLHKNERDFENLNLSDTNVVKWLILYRDKVDLYYGDRIPDNFYDHAGNVKELNKELINLYVCLDELIDKCNFSKDQEAMLKLLFMGYTIKDIKNLTKCVTTLDPLYKRFKKICKMIVDENNRQWKIYIHKNYLDTEFKMCSKCNTALPLTEEFFYRWKNHGYRGWCCKKCTI